MEVDVRDKIQDFINGFLNEGELRICIMKWKLMKSEKVINDVKSAIIGHFHGEVWNDYQNILKVKYF